MVVIPEARPAVIAFGVERGRVVTSAPPTSHRPTKVRVIAAITIAIARGSRKRNSR
jgi:hypothetical protein